MMEMDTNGDIVFNGGSNNGLIKISDLISKMNAIENDLNTMKGIWAACVPVPTDGGTAIKAAFATYAAQLFVPTLQAELENTKVKH